VPEQEGSVQNTTIDLQSALRSLLEADLSDGDLRARLQALVDDPQGATAQPTTDDATDHPGYQ
jgi:hypothetical protein